jgi:hypothetical protein
MQSGPMCRVVVAGRLRDDVEQGRSAKTSQRLVWPVSTARLSAAVGRPCPQFDVPGLRSRQHAQEAMFVRVVEKE